MKTAYHFLALGAVVFAVAACDDSTDSTGSGGSGGMGQTVSTSSTSTSTVSTGALMLDAGPDAAPDGPVTFACKFSSECITELCCNGSCLVPGSVCIP